MQSHSPSLLFTLSNPASIASFRRPCLLLLGLLVALALPGNTRGHGSLENGRMLQVRLAGPSGHTPAPWNDTYYTWNQNSHNFPDYAAAGFSYAATVPDGKIANAGINDGVQTALNFSGLNNASSSWQTTTVTAGGAPVALHWLATALHDPSHFDVYATRAGVNPDTKVLAWTDLELLGRWAVGNATRPVTTSTRPNLVIGGTIPSYDWSVPIPADRAGHVALLIIWQRDDPAGEAFFSVQDLKVIPAATPTPRLALAHPANGPATVDLYNGSPLQTYILQASETLANGTWTPVDSGAADAAGYWRGSDANAASYPKRFYRLVTQP